MFTIILRQGYKHFVKKVCILLPDCKEFEVIVVDERNLMRLMSANIPYDSKPFFVHTLPDSSQVYMLKCIRIVIPKTIGQPILRVY